MKRTIEDYLTDILNECEFMLGKFENVTLDDFLKDESLKRAFVRSLEIVGEASKKIPEKIIKKHPEIRWKEVKGMRNILIHEYFGVNYTIVYNTIKTDVPKLQMTVKNILKELSNK